MGMVEELLKNKEDLLIKFLQVLNGKEAKARVDLNGVQFKLGDSKIQLAGSVEFTVVAAQKGKK